MWPLNASDDDQARINPYGGEAPIPRQRDGRVAPPWQTDDLPALRLVDHGPVDRGPGNGGLGNRGFADRGPESFPAPRAVDEADGDLLIFSQARSAWFVGEPAENEEPFWSPAADEGWSAARRAAEPEVGEETSVGLPRRVPRANLVPGSPLPPMTEHPLHIVRDPAAMAAHTTGYFRGSRRGEEVRGYAVGGRPGRESGGGWDFSRDGWDTDQETGYRSAARR
jgi:hypothetical protein